MNIVIQDASDDKEQFHPFFSVLFATSRLLIITFSQEK
jgi:hypothetical protein